MCCGRLSGRSWTGSASPFSHGGLPGYSLRRPVSDCSLGERVDAGPRCGPSEGMSCRTRGRGPRVPEQSRGHTGAIATLAIGPVATAADDHWVASWATSPAAFFVYTAPVVQNQALAPAPARFAQANIQPDLAFPFPDRSNRGDTTQTMSSIA